MNIFLFIIVGVLLMIHTTQTAQAVPPPDFVFAIGAQVVQIFSIAALLLSALFGSVIRFFQSNPFITRHRKLLWFGTALAVLGLSYIITQLYSAHVQQQSYLDWISQSKQHTASLSANTDVLDTLKIGEFAPAAGPRGENNEDAGEVFIRNYYHNLGSGNISEAYAVSSKVVPLGTYQGWYKDTISVSVDSIQKIADGKYSLGLTLKEKDGEIRYANLMTLKKNSAGNYIIAKSEVRVLAQNSTSTLPRTASIENVGSQPDSFFEHNQATPLAVDNEEFNMVSGQKNIYVLDAREDEEFEIGSFPGSRHIRFADLVAGQWIELPQDRIIYVFCWSGIRGKEVAEFLRTKNIAARFVETGADGWVTFGGAWNGGIKFLSKYTDERYQIVFGTVDVKKYQYDGVVLVDSRNPATYARQHITGSISIPVIYTPTSKLDSVLAQVPAGSRVITVCDDFVSCFDAKVAGVKLEKLGHEFLGRYNRPWEY